MNRSWADMSRKERIKAVAALVAADEKMSSADIAMLLGTSKNAVCGLWHRHPNEFRRERWVGQAEAKFHSAAASAQLAQANRNRANPPANAKPEPKPVKPKRPPQGELIAEGIRAKKALVPKPKAAPMTVAFALPPPLPRVLPPPPDPRGHTLFTVTQFQCRFPLFDDARRTQLTEMFVCGDAVAGEHVYCREHRELTRRVEPPRVRSRVPV